MYSPVSPTVETSEECVVRQLCPCVAGTECVYTGRGRVKVGVRCVLLMQSGVAVNTRHETSGRLFQNNVLK